MFQFLARCGPLIAVVAAVAALLFVVPAPVGAADTLSIVELGAKSPFCDCVKCDCVNCNCCCAKDGLLLAAADVGKPNVIPLPSPTPAPPLLNRRIRVSDYTAVHSAGLIRIAPSNACSDGSCSAADACSTTTKTTLASHARTRVIHLTGHQPLRKLFHRVAGLRACFHCRL